MKKIGFFLMLSTLLACSRSENVSPETEPFIDEKILEIKGADLSYLPELRQSGIILKNAEGQAEDPLTSLKKAGVNTIRLRLWKNPTSPNSSFKSVKNLSQEIKSRGMKVMLSVHYSDTWADPGQHKKPLQWENLSLSALKDSVSAYTQKIVREINPEYLQVGNEINNGFLFPEGSIQNLSQMKTLLKSGIDAAKSANPNVKIILHYAGYQDAQSFYSKLSDLNYDIIGLSYYPLWHGKNMAELESQLSQISQTQYKPIFIAETSYPFTLQWNDQTHNVIGDNTQILSQFSATKEGQKQYLQEIKNMMTKIPKGIGFCYWGAEWVAYKGANATDGSSWENQAFWDFNNQLLPVSEVYK